jgi:predicted aldo/keto reductase-like oxidoreductase
LETIEDCIDCGVCQEACPQRLPIRERLHQSQELFAKPG